MQHRFRAILFILFGLISALPASVFAAQGLTYHGRILTPDDSPVTSNNVNFRIQIKSPGVENCLLFEETQSVDLSATSGVFNLTIGTGSRAASTKDGGYTLDRIFSNRGTIDMTATSPAACTIGTGYSPAAADGRVLFVTFNDNTGTGWQSLPAQTLNFVPQALDSMHFAGYSANNFLRFNDAAALSNSSELNSAQFTNLMDLINGNSALYVRAGTSGSLIPQYAGNPGTLSAGSMWYDSGSNTVKYYNGTAVQTFGTSGGSVSSIATGTGLSGGPITTTGTISIANTTVTAASYGDAANIGTFTVNAQGQLTAAASTPIAISATQITGGALSVASVAATGNVGSNTSSTKSLAIYNAAGTFAATVTVPSSLAANYSLQMPADDGTASQVLTTDGSGLLSWTTPAATGLSTTLADGKIYVGNGSNVGTAVTMSGDASLSNAGALTLATVPVTKGGTGATSFTGNHIVSTNGTGSVLQAFTCSTGQIIKFDASGYATCGTDVGGTPGGATTQVQFNNAGAFAGSANFVWDNTNSRLGIGPSVPDATLEVSSVAGADSSLFLSDEDVAHGATGIVPANVYGALEIMGSGTAGGLKITGVSEAASTMPGIQIKGVKGAGSSSDAAVSFQALEISGTGQGGVDGTEIAFEFRNSNTTQMIIDGDGNVGITQAPVARLDISGLNTNGTFRVFDQTATTGVSREIIREGAGQGATNLTEWQNNAGTVVASVDKAGKFTGDGSGLTGVVGAVSGLTAGRVSLSTGATSLGDSANFLYNSTTGALTMGGSAPSITSTGAITLAAGGANILGFSTAGVERARIDATGNVGIAVTPDTQTKLDVVGQIVSRQVTAAANATSLNLASGNMHFVATAGGSAITLTNMKFGGTYTIVFEDTTSRTYTFTGCTNSYYSPANAPTTTGTRSVYTILVANSGGNTNCYISWITGFL